ncbi:MAG TPA: GNAT family N-acetyltransferase [Anaerolineales bacterium]|nr:GNAT family N-acetyltransferase [Anaerolineales bacterium]
MVDTLGFTIRHGKETDLPALEWEGEYARYRAVYRAAWGDVRRGERALLVAESEDRIVGQIFIHFSSPWPIPGVDRPAGYLYAFRVRPSHRGRGIGRSLLREAETTLTSAGVTHAVIAVAQDNPDARRLYERMGYLWLAEDPGIWSFLDEQGLSHTVHEPADLLVKELDGSF